MPDKQGGVTPEEYEETVTPENPPKATAGSAAMVAGLWYYLAPIGLIVVVALLALFYWGDRNDAPEDSVEPTTGISDETTPGGVNPDPKPDTTREETEFRGGDRR